MNTPSLTQLPVRFQKLISIMSLVYLAMFVVQLAIQQVFNYRMAQFMTFDTRTTDLVMAVGSLVPFVVPFIAGYCLVRGGTIWHRLTAGAVAMFMGMLLDQAITTVAEFFVAQPLFASQYTYVGLSLVSALASLVGLMLLVTRAKWWARRRQLMLWSVLCAVIVMVVGEVMLTVGRGQSSDMLGMTIPVVVVGILGAAAYIFLRSLPKSERLFRTVLALFVAGIATGVLMFTVSAISQYLSMDSLETANLTMAIMPVGMAVVGLAVFAIAVWWARPASK